MATSKLWSVKGCYSCFPVNIQCMATFKDGLLFWFSILKYADFIYKFYLPHIVESIHYSNGFVFAGSLFYPFIAGRTDIPRLHQKED